MSQADTPERDDEELILTDEADGGNAEEREEGGSEGGADDDSNRDEGGDADDEEEVEISFDGEAAPASKGDDSGLVKQLRAEIRKRDQALAEARKGQQPQTIEVGEKPTLEACDYDEAKFEEALDAWKENKAKAEAQAEEAGKASQAQQAAFAEELGTFARQKAALKFKDFDAAEDEVTSALSQVQTAILIKAADDKAKVVYALGRHPQRLAELAAIQDPIKFAAAIAKLEGKLSVTTKRRTAPEPDRPLRGSGQISASTDKELERLEKEAARTGDRSKVIAHKRELKAQGRS